MDKLDKINIMMKEIIIILIVLYLKIVEI